MADALQSLVYEAKTMLAVGERRGEGEGVWGRGASPQCTAAQTCILLDNIE